jgi:glutathionylspermidine synthase
MRWAGDPAAWQRVERAGLRHLNLDARAAGRRYLQLDALVLTSDEAKRLRLLTDALAPLLDRAVDGILEDPEWWSALAWPWPAIELARREPAHPGRMSSLFGRFDFLLDGQRGWQVIEYNADTPSGGREAAGLEPAIARLYSNVRTLRSDLPRQLTRALVDRVRAFAPRVSTVGVVSSHSWIEDMAEATWLAWLLERAGLNTLVGDVNDLSIWRGRIQLRGRPIEALYRFYPVERLYRQAIFADLCEAAIDGQLLLLNGLRGFLAQSKACLAWLWTNRACFDADLIERHLPETLLARDPRAETLLPDAIVKHVNGREGDSVVFGTTLDRPAWESRLLEGGYVVQRAVQQQSLGGQYACVGAFAIGGRFGGCYTRLDGPVTTGLATYAATLRER